MNRRSVLRSVLVWLGAVAAVGLSARPARAYYYFYRYRFNYHVHRTRRRLRWRRRR